MMGNIFGKAVVELVILLPHTFQFPVGAFGGYGEMLNASDSAHEGLASCEPSFVGIGVVFHLPEHERAYSLADNHEHPEDPAADPNSQACEVEDKAHPNIQ